MAGSSWRMEPAAALRGLAKSGSPSALLMTLSFSKPERVRYTSPSATRVIGRVSVIGTDLMVRILCVTSSPITPSPRVDAVTRMPFSYVKTTFNPSILSSRSYAGTMPLTFRTRSSNARTSSCEKASLNDHCGTACCTFLRNGIAPPIMRPVTELGSASSGYCFSSSTSSAWSAS